MALSAHDLIIINSSGGKDSLCAIFEVCKMAKQQGFPLDKIIVSHQDLGKSEWKHTKDLAEMQALLFGLRFVVSKRRDKNGKEETLLEYAKRRGKWPSSTQRWCTSDFKRGPGARVVTAETKNMGKCSVLYVFGFRREESPARAKKVPFKLNKMLTTKQRTVYDWCPILEWSVDLVWYTIHKHSLPYHKAYDLGMPRLSCVFCIFSPFDALVLAGKHNPELLEEYVQVEQEIGHTFRQDCSLKSVQEAVERGHTTGKIQDWTM